VSRKLASGMTPLLPAGVEVTVPTDEPKRAAATRWFRRPSRPVSAEVLS
jgi:hypothetical protein